MGQTPISGSAPTRSGGTRSYACCTARARRSSLPSWRPASPSPSASPSVAAADEVYENPKHPYTAALLSAVPKSYGDTRASERIVLQGDVPSPVDPPSGCAFHPRCPKARLISGSRDSVPETCRTTIPELVKVERDHSAACWYPVEKGEALDRAAHA